MIKWFYPPKPTPTPQHPPKNRSNFIAWYFVYDLVDSPMDACPPNLARCQSCRPWGRPQTHEVAGQPFHPGPRGPRNEIRVCLIAGFIKGNQWVFISRDHKALFLRGVGIGGRAPVDQPVMNYAIFVVDGTTWIDDHKQISSAHIGKNLPAIWRWNEIK